MDASHKFIPAINDAEDLAGGRIAPRESLFVMGKLYYEGISIPVDVRVRNLSATGMMVESARLGQLGEKVEIEMKAYGRLKGYIAWIAEKRMGIALDVQIETNLTRKSITERSPEGKWEPPTHVTELGKKRIFLR